MEQHVYGYSIAPSLFDRWSKKYLIEGINDLKSRYANRALGFHRLGTVQYGRDARDPMGGDYCMGTSMSSTWQSASA